MALREQRLWTRASAVVAERAFAALKVDGGETARTALDNPGTAGINADVAARALAQELAFCAAPRRTQRVVCPL
ncbi:hypothetical protein BJJ97_17205 [Pectobacterium polaris]|nr:hypothetical protein BJJ97_17205 [Pectobacterium polaris]